MHHDIASIYVQFIVRMLACANIKRAISDSKNTEVKSKEQSFQVVSSCLHRHQQKKTKRKKIRRTTDKVFLMHPGSKGSTYSHNA